MKNADPLLMLLASGGDETAEALLQEELALVRTLTRRGLVSTDDLGPAVRLRKSTGLLLEHCLVKIGAVEFETMVELMTERRARAGRGMRRSTGDGGYGTDRGPLAG